MLQVPTHTQPYIPRNYSFRKFLITFMVTGHQYIGTSWRHRLEEGYPCTWLLLLILPYQLSPLTLLAGDNLLLTLMRLVMDGNEWEVTYCITHYTFRTSSHTYSTLLHTLIPHFFTYLFHTSSHTYSHDLLKHRISLFKISSTHKYIRIHIKHHPHRTKSSSRQYTLTP